MKRMSMLRQPFQLLNISRWLIKFLVGEGLDPPEMLGYGKPSEKQNRLLTWFLCACFVTAFMICKGSGGSRPSPTSSLLQHLAGQDKGATYRRP